MKTASVLDRVVEEVKLIPTEKLPELLDVISVEPHENNTLFLVFENKEKRQFDMAPYLDKKPLTKLKGSPLFMKARVSLGSVVWPGNIDIAPETLWDYSKPVEKS